MKQVDLCVVDFSGFDVKGTSLLDCVKASDGKIFSCFCHRERPFSDSSFFEILASRCVSLLRNDLSGFVLHQVFLVQSSLCFQLGSSKNLPFGSNKALLRDDFSFEFAKRSLGKTFARSRCFSIPDGLVASGFLLHWFAGFLALGDSSLL